ncbi:HAD-IB family phosphatase [Fodinibius salsisoli]|uniref:phosphoserine phosphatase n=1 Tax=Fodinibius salsisoli TaxID=2820877 RepID=A0ABT3PRG5_9BACT|nr:HAD-IB family phosphatase [Fodinibius salsisoli]MCW9708454.1 HAD-IB family phosphatase [Fodinibius salsisoli]
MNNQKFIIDFDSTFVSVESLDLLATLSLDGRADKEEKVQQIADITDLGMNGDISFTDSLKRRLAVLEANRSHLQALIPLLKSNISPSFERNRDFIQEHSDSIYIISSGFKEFIVPVVADFGIAEDHVLANTFEFDGDGNITGADQQNPLAGDGGKIKVVEELGLTGDILVIGDGYTDFEIKQAGLAEKFFAFTENVSRDNVVEEATFVVPSLDEVLFAKQT